MTKPFVGLSVKDFIKCFNKSSRLKDYDVMFIKDNKAIREIKPMDNHKVGEPIKASEIEFINNGYEQLLNCKVIDSFSPYNGGTKSLHITIE